MGVTVFTLDPDTVKWLADVHSARMVAKPQRFNGAGCYDSAGAFTRLKFEPEWPSRQHKQLVRAMNKLRDTTAS